MSKVILEFSDENTLEIPTELLSKYPSNPFSGYLESTDSRECKYKIPELTMVEFEPIYQMLKGEINETDLPKYIWNIANKYSLTNNVLYFLRQHHKKQMAQNLREVDDFLIGITQLYIPKPEEYECYVNALMTENNIVPIQVLMYSDFIISVSIYSGCPILYEPEHSTTNILSNLEGNINIQQLRYEIAFDLKIPTDATDLDEYNFYKSKVIDHIDINSIKIDDSILDKSSFIEPTVNSEGRDIWLGNLFSDNLEVYYRELTAIHSIRDHYNYDIPFIYQPFKLYADICKPKNINIEPELQQKILSIVNNKREHFKSIIKHREINFGLTGLNVTHIRDSVDIWIKPYNLIKCFVNI